MLDTQPLPAAAPDAPAAATASCCSVTVVVTDPLAVRVVAVDVQ